jgi:hypothetical protein
MNMPRLLTVGRVIGQVAEIGVNIYDESGNVIETHEHKGEFKERSVHFFIAEASVRW